jgi:hypothetical protein
MQDCSCKPFASSSESSSDSNSDSNSKAAKQKQKQQQHQQQQRTMPEHRKRASINNICQARVKKNQHSDIKIKKQKVKQ